MKKLAALILSLLVFSTSVFAMNGPSVLLPDDSVKSKHWHPALNVEATGGSNGNFIADGLFPVYHNSDSVGFIDTEVGFEQAAPNFDTKKTQKAFFVAGGYRHEIGRAGILGGYFGYGNDKSVFNTNAEQIVYGLEWLSIIDFRANFYSPQT